MALLRGVAGMVPPDGDDIVPGRNVVHGVVLVATSTGWRVAHFSNRPAASDRRTDPAAFTDAGPAFRIDRSACAVIAVADVGRRRPALTAELRAVLAADRNGS